MKNNRTSLKTSMLIGFFFVFPFMILEWVNRREFDESFPGPLFALLWLGVTGIALLLTPIVRTRRAGKENPKNLDFASENVATPGTKPLSSSVLPAFLLALPFMAIATMFIFKIEPPFSRLLGNPDPNKPDIAGSLIVAAAFLLAVIAAVIVRVPIIRTMRAGGGLFAHRANVALATMLLFFIASLVIGLFVDQLPCFMGVPNCD